MTASTPRTVAHRYRQQLCTHLPGVRDGRPDAVHDARVATRRLRELMPLLHAPDSDRLDETLQVLKKTGRALGRVRELDVMFEMLHALERRVPAAAGAAAVARQRIAQQRLAERRTMIKRLERLDVAHAELIPAASSLVTALADNLPGVTWRRELRERVATRARRLSEAMHHATGVYFPNRMHGGRIATKQLRYAVEAADQTGLWRASRLLDDLKRVQGGLGELHDAQVLLDHLDGFVDPGVFAESLALLKDTLRADIDALHGRYLDRRPRLERIVAAALDFAEGGAGRLARQRLAPLAAVSATLIPAGLVLLARRQPRASEQREAPETQLVLVDAR